MPNNFQCCLRGGPDVSLLVDLGCSTLCLCSLSRIWEWGSWLRVSKINRIITCKIESCCLCNSGQNIAAAKSDCLSRMNTGSISQDQQYRYESVHDCFFFASSSEVQSHTPGPLTLLQRLSVSLSTMSSRKEKSATLYMWISSGSVAMDRNSFSSAFFTP